MLWLLRSDGRSLELVGKQSRAITKQQRLARAAAERRRAKRNRMLGYGGGMVIFGLLVAIVVAVVNALGGPARTSADTAAAKLVAPANTTAAGAITLGSPGAPVKVDIYLDYICPFCGRFERANAGELERLLAEGTIRVDLYVMSFLDRASGGTRYSTRAANAMATVADRAPDKAINAAKARQ